MSDENERARARAGYGAQHGWQRQRRRTTVQQYVGAKQQAEWLARERAKAAQINLTPEEIEEDKGYERD